MKRTLLVALLFVLSDLAPSLAQEVRSEARLTGVANLPSGKLALLELQDARVRPRPPEQLSLLEGQELNGLSVRAIDLDSGIVQIRNRGIDSTLNLDPKLISPVWEGPSPHPKTGEQLGPGFGPFDLRGTDVQQFIDLYGLVTERTLLQHAALPHSLVSFKTDRAFARPALVVAFDSVLAKQGIIAIPDGEKFAKLVPARLASTFTNSTSATEGASLTLADATKAAEVMPSGLIKMLQIDISQFLEYYAYLIDRTVLRPASLPSLKLTCQTQTPLTRDEGAYALTALLMLNGWSVIPNGEKFVIVLPKDQTNLLASVSLVTPRAGGAEVAVGARLSFANAPLAQVLNYYSDLSGTLLTPEQNLPSVRISLRAQTPLTKSEAIGALETVLALNGIRIVPVDDKTAKAVVASPAMIRPAPQIQKPKTP